MNDEFVLSGLLTIPIETRRVRAPALVYRSLNYGTSVLGWMAEAERERKITARGNISRNPGEKGSYLLTVSRGFLCARVAQRPLLRDDVEK